MNRIRDWTSNDFAKPWGLVFFWLLSLIIAGVLCFYDYLQKEIFFSVLLGALLAHISSAFVASISDKSQQEREHLQEKKERIKLIAILTSEVGTNWQLVKDIRTYFGDVYSMPQDNFLKRKKDPLLCQFSLLCRGYWKELIPVIGYEASNSEQVILLYEKFEYCNRLLENTAIHIRNNVRYGDVFQSYLGALRTNPWDYPLQVALAELESELEKSGRPLLDALEKIVLALNDLDK